VTRFLAWLGGAIFVASLAFTAWWFFVELGRPVSYRGVAPLVVDALLVTLFASHHSLFARERVKRALIIVPSSLLRSSYVWVASLLLIAVIALWQPIGGTLYVVSGPAAAANALLQAAGVWVIARAVSGLDPLELAGIRQASGTSGRPEPLQISGPYRVVRHPLYLGWMIALFGAARMTGDRLAFAALTSIYLVIAIPWEEGSLRQSYGADYDRYATRVRWRVLPYIY